MTTYVNFLQLRPADFAWVDDLIEIRGADYITLGTDYPFDMAEPDPVGFPSRVKGVSKEVMALAAGDNAGRLLGLAKAKP